MRQKLETFQFYHLMNQFKNELTNHKGHQMLMTEIETFKKMKEKGFILFLYFIFVFVFIFIFIFIFFTFFFILIFILLFLNLFLIF